MPTQRICLWAGPRNVSTALMYSFASRSDTCVIDEPLYAHYLHVTGASHPISEVVIGSMEKNGAKVVRDVILGACDKPVLFMKQMCHHLVQLELGFLRETTNILLIRQPREMLPSLAKVIGIPTLSDTGFKVQSELLARLKLFGQSPPILDAQELLKNPENVLTQLCQHLGLPFQSEMLAWERGAHPADGIWAKHWYRNVHKTTGFEPYRPKTEPFPTELRSLLDECTPYYEALRDGAITAD